LGKEKGPKVGEKRKNPRFWEIPANSRAGKKLQNRENEGKKKGRLAKKDVLYAHPRKKKGQRAKGRHLKNM